MPGYVFLFYPLVHMTCELVDKISLNHPGRNVTHRPEREKAGKGYLKRVPIL